MLHTQKVLKASKTNLPFFWFHSGTLGPRRSESLTVHKVESGPRTGLTLERATKGNLSISSRVSSPVLWCSWPLRMRVAVTVETPIPVGDRELRLSAL